MKRTKFIVILTTLLLILAVVAGCAKEVSRTPIDKRFIPAHSETQAYIQMLPNGRGGMIAQPMVRTIHKPDCYQILYSIEYDDGKTFEEWITVSKGLYEETIIE